MREIADQVFAQSAATDSTQLRSKLAVLGDRLSSLLVICSQYKQLLDGALRNRGASLSPSTPTGLNLNSPSPELGGSPHRSIVVLPVEVSPCFRKKQTSLTRAFIFFLSFFSYFYFITLIYFIYCAVAQTFGISPSSPRFVHGRAHFHQHRTYKVCDIFFVTAQPVFTLCTKTYHLI